MANSLDDLENEAAARRRGDGGRRNAGESRNPRKPASESSEAARREELARREQERLRREHERRQREEKPEAPLPAKDKAAPPPPREQPEAEAAVGKKQQRPKSIPFYPNAEHETFLWRVTEAGAARQERIPATAVLRLALTRLEQQMTPGEIVQLLGEAVQPAGKMGRPRK